MLVSYDITCAETVEYYSALVGNAYVTIILNQQYFEELVVCMGIFKFRDMNKTNANTMDNKTRKLEISKVS